MNETLKVLKKIWHDSVWSKVIAVAIVASAGYFFGLVEWAGQQVLRFYEYISAKYGSNPYEVLTWVLAILLLVAVVVLWKRRPKKHIGLGWIRQLNVTQLSKYSFLFWFPLNKRLKTQIYTERRSFMWGQISFDHIPSIRELIDKNVLRHTFEGLGEYSIEINGEVYSHLEQIYEQQLPLMDEKTKTTFDQYRGASFDSFFPDARQ